MCTFCFFFHVRPVVVISNPSNDDSAVAECLWAPPPLPSLNKNNLRRQRQQSSKPPSISLLEQTTVSKYLQKSCTLSAICDVIQYAIQR